MSFILASSVAVTTTAFAAPKPGKKSKPKAVETTMQDSLAAFKKKGTPKKDVMSDIAAFPKKKGFKKAPVALV